MGSREVVRGVVDGQGADKNDQEGSHGGDGAEATYGYVDTIEAELKRGQNLQ
jgi:hypothetical protein